MQALRLDKVERRADPVRQVSPLTRARRAVPGVIAGAADLDPAAVLTATVAGAGFGYALGWVVLVCMPVLFSLFAVSSRIGHQTGKGLVQLIREHYGRSSAIPIAIFMVLVNMAMIVGDIVAVSDGLSIIMGQHRTFFLAAVGFVVWYILILGSYQKTTKALGSITLLLVAYLVAAYRLTDSLPALAQGILLPKMQFNAGYMMGVVAVFGSLLTPDVIVWQTSSRRGVPKGLAEAHVTESHTATFVACLICLCTMIAASHLHVAHASSMTTRTAADALGSFGGFGPLLFSLGIVGSGLVALPVLVASLCFSVAEAFQWKSSLALAPWEARGFFVLISATVFVAVFIDFLGINTVQVLYWSQAMAGVVLVPIFAFILLVSNNRKVMRTTNKRYENLCLGGATVAMMASNLIFLYVGLFR